MFAIAGATGHVGGATARELLGTGQPVKALVRDAAKGEALRAQGAQPAVVHLDDQAGLTNALNGADGFFAMLPFSSGATDDGAQRQLTDSIIGAVRDSGVPHVVLLSSVGADLAEGTGPIRWLHYLENGLRSTGTVLSAIRSFHFQEKFETVLDPVLNAGIFPNFGESADVAKPMIATRDVGALAAATLLAPPSASEVIDIDGPRYTERQVAQKLGAALGVELNVVNIPRAEWVETLEQSGLSRHFSEEVAELYDADERGLLQPNGDRVHRATTEIEDTIAAVLPAP